jgi:glucan-binding YG repeat protein
MVQMKNRMEKRQVELKAKLTCGKCHKVFASHRSKSNHIKKCKGKPDFVCDKCGKAFVSFKQLKAYKISNCLNECENCGSKFPMPTKLRRHLNGKRKCKPPSSLPTVEEEPSKENESSKKLAGTKKINTTTSAAENTGAATTTPMTKKEEPPKANETSKESQEVEEPAVKKGRGKAKGMYTYRNVLMEIGDLPPIDPIFYKDAADTNHYGDLTKIVQNNWYAVSTLGICILGIHTTR